MPELIRPPQAELDSMSHPEEDALILLLFDVLARYEQRLSAVEGKVEKASQNSSKPPSSVEGKEAVAEARTAGQTAVEPAHVNDLLARYDQQVQNGLAACPVRPPGPGRTGRVKQHEATHLLLPLRDYKTQWRFLTDWRVPFDNNLAERQVRPAKVKLKVTGGFRALGGTAACCILRSVWETNKLNGINPFDTLRLVFEGR